MITLFLGENEIARDESFRAYEKSFRNAHGDLSIFKIDTEITPKNEFIDAILSVPLFSDKKLVRLVRLEKNKEFLEILVSNNTNIPDNCEVVIVADSFDGRLKTAQELLRMSTVREFPNLDRANLERWLASYFQQEGASISSSDIRYLIDRVGENQQSLYQEAAKLSLLKTIDKAKIDAMTNKSLTSTVFNLLDALSAENAKKALEIYDEQTALGGEPLAILGMISWQLFNVSLVYSGIQNMTKPELMKASGLSPFVFRKTVALAEKVNRRQIIYYLDKTIDAEFQIKNKPVNIQAVLKNLILQLSAK